ncbi:hypothetical protein BHM03_00041912 [Ensete ventricosum]|nr:hypothetical protein BHM03_00041912 [Ensete ventricosum]
MLDLLHLLLPYLEYKDYDLPRVLSIDIRATFLAASIAVAPHAAAFLAAAPAILPIAYYRCHLCRPFFLAATAPNSTSRCQPHHLCLLPFLPCRSRFQPAIPPLCCLTPSAVTVPPQLLLHPLAVVALFLLFPATCRVIPLYSSRCPYLLPLPLPSASSTQPQPPLPSTLLPLQPFPACHHCYCPSCSPFIVDSASSNTACCLSLPTVVVFPRRAQPPLSQPTLSLSFPATALATTTRLCFLLGGCSNRTLLPLPLLPWPPSATPAAPSLALLDHRRTPHWTLFLLATTTFFSSLPLPLATSLILLPSSPAQPSRLLHHLTTASCCCHLAKLKQSYPSSFPPPLLADAGNLVVAKSHYIYDICP